MHRGVCHHPSRRHEPQWPRALASDLRRSARQLERGLSRQSGSPFFAPPFAPVYDPVLIAATVARKRLGAAERKEAAATGRGER